jgi:hypothetical protein
MVDVVIVAARRRTWTRYDDGGVTDRVMVAVLSAVVVLVRVTGSGIAIALRVVGVCASCGW